MDDKELEMYWIFQAIDGAAVRRREGVGNIGEALGCWAQKGVGSG
ncbi:unnamed protein product [Prunus armeniaca]|uniref:Uncharacterized protein n=1 Tax=Prunus armeniaca TaxID=36596 RepID=A0A6J5VZ66_PRUAR|nr:unnamed protein product [Prunus armeniaca]